MGPSTLHEEARLRTHRSGPLSFLDGLTQYLLDTVGAWGLVGIFVLMAIESSFIPFPSEVVMIPAGYLAYQGELNLFAAILMGTLGSVVGAWINYFLALHLGRPAMHRIGKKFLVSEKTMTMVEVYFAKHGSFTTFVGRLLPAVRQLISIPAGLARMPFGRFTLLTAAGAGLWVTVLALLGYFIGDQASESSDVLRTTTIAVLAVVAALILMYVLGKRYFIRHVKEHDLPKQA
ncbi:MAG TPA: DedA family protein [Candidatus Thermoplasmatota archaeon]|nr:DedA family protein [Candidatus Thermoplasmatota archaeon]